MWSLEACTSPAAAKLMADDDGAWPEEASRASPDLAQGSQGGGRVGGGRAGRRRRDAPQRACCSRRWMAAARLGRRAAAERRWGGSGGGEWWPPTVARCWFGAGVAWRSRGSDWRQGGRRRAWEGATGSMCPRWRTTCTTRSRASCRARVPARQAATWRAACAVRACTACGLSVF
jgi:hypothetical protein